jgi:hypothetical protein
MAPLRFGAEARQGFAVCKEKIAAYAAVPGKMLIALHFPDRQIDARRAPRCRSEPWTPAALGFLDGPDEVG